MTCNRDVNMDAFASSGRVQRPKRADLMGFMPLFTGVGLRSSSGVQTNLHDTSSRRHSQTPNDIPDCVYSFCQSSGALVSR